MYLPLMKRGRIRVRGVARQAYDEARGDQEKAIALATERLESIFVTFLVSLAIKLAVELIIYWIRQNYLVAPMTYQEGEPGYTPEPTPT